MSEKSVRSIEKAPVAILQIEEGRVAYANAAARTMLGGADKSEVVGLPFESFLTEGEAPGYSEYVRARLEKADSISPFVTLRVRQANGEERYAEAHVSVTAGKAGTSVQLAALDITERFTAENRLRALEAELRRNHKMEAIERLAGSLAHDFNNVLTVINATAELVLQMMPPDDALREDVGEIALAGKRAAALTQQLLAFSRRQTLRIGIVEIDETIRGLAPSVQNGIPRNIRLAVKLNASGGRVRADGAQIEQVVMKLVANAIEAMPDGGDLTIETAHVEIGELEAERHVGLAPGSYVGVRVMDTGCGMDEATKSHLFEPFFTTKGRGKGTGLSLSGSYGIVTQAGGYFRVASRPGRGSTFTFLLPRIAEGVSKPPEPPIDEDLLGSETILLVESDEHLRRLAVSILMRQGYKVLSAATGLEALRLAHATHTPIHLLVVDSIMPGMTGNELRRQLHEIRPGIRVLFLTRYPPNEAETSAPPDESPILVRKSLLSEQLAAGVRRALDREET